MAKAKQYEARLEEIANTSFGTLSDDEVLQLLAERKQLEELRKQYEAAQVEQAERTKIEEEQAHVEQELARLNALISPEKPDDELIKLIEERKTWEAKQEEIKGRLVSFGGTPAKKTEKEAVVTPPQVEEVSEPEPAVSPESLPVTEKTEELAQEVGGVVAPQGIQDEVDEEYGTEKIVASSLDPSSELFQHLEQIRNNMSSIGKILDNLPADAKRNKAFMLEVAKLDPAYAMHYADKDVLKKDEDFNLKVVSVKNERNSGSVLAEMLPEARTGKVVMAAIKQDYRNVRFALPQMPGYDEMLEKAKRVTLDKVKELKESVDPSILVPKILQKDKAFMKKVEAIAPQEKE